MYMYGEFTDLIDKNNVRLVFLDIRGVRCIQENRVVIVDVFQENMDFGHVIFVFFIESSSVVCEHKELKLRVFLVIQDFGGFDGTIRWLDCETVEKKKQKNKKKTGVIELDSFYEWIERKQRLIFPLIIHFRPRLLEGFHSRGQQLWKFIETKGSVYIRKEFNSHRIDLVHQHDRIFIVLEHQYGCCDVMWKHFMACVVGPVRVHRPPQKFQIAASFLRLGLPSILDPSWKQNFSYTLLSILKEFGKADFTF